MFDAFKKLISDVAGEAETLFARVTDKRTFMRVVYAAYLIARADGDFDSSEKSALAKLIDRDFPQFSINDILSALDEAESRVAFDENMGVMEILSEIGKATGESADLIMRTSCYIGAADGNFDDDEKAVARQICERLNISPGTYGL